MLMHNTKMKPSELLGTLSLLNFPKNPSYEAGQKNSSSRKFIHAELLS